MLGSHAQSCDYAELSGSFISKKEQILGESGCQWIFGLGMRKWEPFKGRFPRGCLVSTGCWGTGKAVEFGGFHFFVWICFSQTVVGKRIANKDMRCNKFTHLTLMCQDVSVANGGNCLPFLSSHYREVRDASGNGTLLGAGAPLWEGGLCCRRIPKSLLLGVVLGVAMLDWVWIEFELSKC